MDKALGRISPAGTFSGYRGGQPFERPASIGDAGLCYKFKSMSEKVRWSARQVRGAMHFECKTFPARTALCLGIVACSLVPCASEPANDRILQILVRKQGIYLASGDDRLLPTVAGDVYRVRDVKLVRGTTVIPIHKGLRFGLHYTVVERAPGFAARSISLRMVTKFPHHGLSDPRSGETYFRKEYVIERPLGSSGYRVFHLDEDWELVPGLWVFEFWHDDKKIAEQEFCLFVPVDDGNGVGCAEPTS